MQNKYFKKNQYIVKYIENWNRISVVVTLNG